MLNNNTHEKPNTEKPTYNISISEDFIRKAISDAITNGNSYGIDDVLGENLKITFYDKDGIFRLCDFISKNEVDINPKQIINTAFCAFCEEYLDKLTDVIGEELHTIIAYDRAIQDYDSVKGLLTLCSSVSEPKEKDIIYEKCDIYNVIPMITFLHAKSTNLISHYPVKTSHLEKWGITKDELLKSLHDNYDKNIRFTPINTEFTHYGEMISCNSNILKGKLNTEPQYHVISSMKVRKHIHSCYPNGAYVSFPTEFIGFIWDDDFSLSQCDALTMNKESLQDKVETFNHIVWFTPYSRSEEHSFMRSALYFIPNNPNEKIRKIA